MCKEFNSPFVFIGLLMLAVISVGNSASYAQSGGANAILPKPASVSIDSGSMELTAAARIIYATRSAPRAIESSLQPLAEVLASEIELVTGIRPNVVARSAGNPGPGDISLEFQIISGAFAVTEAEENQAYRLTVGDSVVISSQYYKGVAYGTASLVQAVVANVGNYTVQRMHIDDRPASAYRAVMIDIARQKHTQASLKDLIRLARQYKLRYLHLHVTDDQNFVFPFTPVTDNVSSNYTISRSDFIDLVNYADARGITIIPELDLPGHSTKLRQSGYLNAPADSDRDVAGSWNYGKIQGIVDDMLSVFESTPYFHIGGDESGAGDRLVPFLGAMNRHIRARGRRMLVWEGFGGAPTQIPATGSDRAIVMSWESSYNAPWDLLNSGYTIINASWRPLYLVSSGKPMHPGTGVRRWPEREIYSWSADTFMHWEPGRPVYKDAGPNDPNRSDSRWRASYIGREGQVLGGQLLFWEATDQYIIPELRRRLPALAERLWNPSAGSFSQHKKRLDAIDNRVMTIVRPVEAVVGNEIDPSSPISSIYRIYEGDSIAVTLKNRSQIQANIRYETDAFDGRLDWIHSGRTAEPSATSPAYQSPIEKSGGFGVRAQLYRSNGTPIDGVSWEVFNNWKQRVTVTEFRRGRDEYPLSGPVPDLTRIDKTRTLRQYQMPSMRGSLVHVRRNFQHQLANLGITTGGNYTLSVKTQSGRATAYVDLNRNGSWESNEAVIRDTPPSEQQANASLSLSPGEYRIRIDHMTDQPRSALIVALDGPDTNNQRREISEYLLPVTPPAPASNIAQYRPTITSSDEGFTDYRTGAQAVDGNQSTRWTSEYSDLQWIRIDLGARYDINRVRLSWETAFGKAYEIQVSDDASNWQTIFTATNGDGAVDDLAGLSGTGRYIRMYGTARGTQWGYALWEFEVYGTKASDVQPKISISDTRVNENDATASLTISMNVAATDSVSVNAATTRGGTASPGIDFTPLSNVVTIPAGETSRTVAVTINDDVEVEPDETINVLLTNATGADIADPKGVITVVDNDSGDPTRPTLSISANSVSEGDGSARLKVQLSKPSATTVAVSVATRAGTAQAGQDYYGVYQKLQFAPNETEKVIDVEILNDSASEGAEQFFVRLFGNEGAEIAIGEATITISDDDSGPTATLSVSDVTIDEDAGNAEVTVTLSNAAEASVTVHTRPATALGRGEDYFGFSRNLTFTGGQLTQTVNVTVVDDTIAEDTEFLEIRLVNPSGAGIGDGVARVTINDDDGVVDPGGSTMININSGLCMAVKDRSTSLGADMIQGDCADVAHQRFKFVSDSDGYGNVRASHSGLCLAVRAASLEVGQPIEQHQCTFGRNHVFAPVDAFGNKSRVKFKARSTGMCLTVKDSSNSDGAIIVQEPCRRGDGSQLWTTDLADAYIGKGGPGIPRYLADFHGPRDFASFGDGLIRQDAWTFGDIAFYNARSQVPASAANQWLSWYYHVDQLYRKMSARPDFNTVYRRDDRNFGRKKVLAVIDNDRNSCGSANAAGCGSKQQAQAARDYLPRMLADSSDWLEHWIFFYEMGRGGSPERFVGRAVWPKNTLIFPHLMAGISFHALGGDAGLERGIPGLLLDGLVAWEQSDEEFVNRFATKQSHDILAAILYRILQETSIDSIERILRLLETKPLAQTAERAMCDFQDAVIGAVGSTFNSRMKGPWGLPDDC